MADVVVPVPAATIILLRETRVSPEVLMIQRSVKSELLTRCNMEPMAFSSNIETALIKMDNILFEQSILDFILDCLEHFS